jgi:hypothetical protein
MHQDNTKDCNKEIQLISELLLELKLVVTEEEKPT